MSWRPLPPREEALSIWVRDRLGERAAVLWAAQNFKGTISQGLVQLFEFLDKHAEQQDSVPAVVKKTWLLMRVAAQDNMSVGWDTFWDPREEIKSAKPDFANRLITWVRPRLSVEPPWRETEDGEETDPLRWVRWKFNTRAGTLDRFEGRLPLVQMTGHDARTLVQIIEMGTQALKQALDYAEMLGWFRDGADLVSYYVNSVADPEEVVKSDFDGSDSADHDPDAYNSDFAPICRLLTTSFSALRMKSPESARSVAVSQWPAAGGSLISRMGAFAMRFPEFNGEEVGSFLESISDRLFWISNHSPEVAALRAARWNDLPPVRQRKLEMRLLAMPSRELFGDNAHLSEIIERYRDRELARILDAGGHLGKTAEGFVQTRRAVDERFPDRVAAVELRGGLIAREVEPGDARLFEDVPASSLLRSLIEAQRSRGFDRGDDADAFAATAVGKARIAEALQDEPDSAVAEAGWTYLLSYPPRKSDDTSVAKDVVRRVSELSVSASLELMKGVADRFAYWLDAADEVFPDFEGARALWLRLLPYADEMSNTKASDSASDTVSDLSAAALNEPLGRLMSMYLRKCPEGAPNNPPKLPQPMTEMLRKLRGRSRQIVANRVALSMRYFAMADPEWLEDLVLQPMMSDDLDGKRIWEAVARYGDMPPPSLWSKLASSAYLKLAKGEFSPEARRRIAEMAILAWGWARLELVRFEVDGKALRSALSLAGDDVRTQAAWTFLRLLKEPVPESKFANDVWKAVGPAFFGEIWPLEPSLQGSGSSNHLAEVPFKVNANDFGAAANEVLPFLRPFEMWNVRSELGLDGEHARHLIATSPRIVVQILSAIIPEAPKHRVYGLNALLDELAQTEPALRRDRRMKALRRTAALEFS